MKKLLHRLFLVVALPVASVLGGCETAPPSTAMPDIRFTHLPPLVLDVASIEVSSEYVSPFSGPNVEHLFPVTPRMVLETWAADRLRAGGPAGKAQFVILNAAVTETSLQKAEGVEGMLKKEESERYDGVIEARLEIYSADGARMVYVTANANRSQTVLEDASPNDRRRAWLDMTEAMMTDFNAEVERVIRDQLPGVVR